MTSKRFFMVDAAAKDCVSERGLLCGLVWIPFCRDEWVVGQNSGKSSAFKFLNLQDAGDLS